MPHLLQMSFEILECGLGGPPKFGTTCEWARIAFFAMRGNINAYLVIYCNVSNTTQHKGVETAFTQHADTTTSKAFQRQIIMH